MSGSIETLIVAGAPVTDPVQYETVVRNATRLVAVDRGADLALALNRTPDVVIGDLDSISEKSLGAFRTRGAEFVRLPVDKDVTDLDAALDLCRARDWSPPTVTAAFGGRPDHGIAVLGSLARNADMGVVVREPAFRGWMLSPDHLSELEIEGAGRVFSVFALLVDASVRISGVRYPLAGELLPPLSSRGLSNVVTEPVARIVIDAGVVLVISHDVTSVTAHDAAHS